MPPTSRTEPSGLMIMNAANPGSPIDLTSVPRAVLSITLGVLRTVERTVTADGRSPTARANAWAAVCADRERARQRDEIRRTVAALAGRGVGQSRGRASSGSASVGSSPRSRASQVSTSP